MAEKTITGKQLNDLQEGLYTIQDKMCIGSQAMEYLADILQDGNVCNLVKVIQSYLDGIADQADSLVKLCEDPKAKDSKGK